MHRRIFTAILIVAMTSTLAIAQSTTNTPTPPTPAQIAARQVARLTKLLDLTPAQQTQATTIFTTEQTTLAGFRTNMETAHTTLETAIKSNDIATMNAEATQIGTLNGQEVLARATAVAAFYAILTADQQSKFDTLGPLGGFGGPRGFGGFGPHARGGSH